jgi:acylphosphatase
MQKTVHGFISGRVQGVWFRAFVKDQSIKANITGWARNLKDGRVEVMLSGEESDLTLLCNALHKGSPLSRVDEVSITNIEYQPFSDFTIRYI